jgi:hypothetical protein
MLLEDLKGSVLQLDASVICGKPEFTRICLGKVLMKIHRSLDDENMCKMKSAINVRYARLFELPDEYVGGTNS